MKNGALDGGPKCRMSILRNCNVACPCRLFFPMSHVEFKKRLCHMSLLSPICRMSSLRNTHVAFRGLEPYKCSVVHAVPK